MTKKLYSPIRIIIADDHEVFRFGLQFMLKVQENVELVGEAENGKDLIQQVENTNPDIVVTDIKMPKLDGIEATRIIKQKWPHIHVIALTMFDDEALIVDMLEAGARGYLLKNANKTEIMDAIKTVYEGMTYYCNHTSDKLTQMIIKSKYNPLKKASVPEFTEKETQLIRMTCQGLSNKEIAAQLDLSIRTIESYRERISEKTGIKNTAGLVIYAIKSGIYEV